MRVRIDYGQGAIAIIRVFRARLRKNPVSNPNFPLPNVTGRFIASLRFAGTDYRLDMCGKNRRLLVKALIDVANQVISSV